MGRKRFFQVEHIGSPGDRYMTRYTIGRHSLHVIHRADADPACHDHPKGFWTFPLTGYYEDVLEYLVSPDNEHLDDRVRRNYVAALWPHRREPTYRHRIDWRSDLKFPIVTLVLWDRENVREWGFWPRGPGGFAFVPWRQHLGLDQ